MNMASKVLTAREVADRLNLNSYTVYEYLRTGVLRGFKMRRKWGILEEDYEKFIRRRAAK